MEPGPFGVPAGGVLGRLIADARSAGLLVVLDVKRGDVGSTNARDESGRRVLPASGDLTSNPVRTSLSLRAEREYYQIRAMSVSAGADKHHGRANTIILVAGLDAGDLSVAFRCRLAAVGGPAAMVAVQRRANDGTFWYEGPRRVHGPRQRTWRT